MACGGNGQYSKIYDAMELMMFSKQDVHKKLNRIDGKGYKAYRDLQGTYDFGDWVLHIDHVKSDPFAPPSKLRIFVPAQRSGFSADFLANPVRRWSKLNLEAAQDG